MGLTCWSWSRHWVPPIPLRMIPTLLALVLWNMTNHCGYHKLIHLCRAPRAGVVMQKFQERLKRAAPFLKPLLDAGSKSSSRSLSSSSEGGTLPDRSMALRIWLISTKRMTVPPTKFKLFHWLWIVCLYVCVYICLDMHVAELEKMMHVELAGNQVQSFSYCS